ncbi:hypothetical protein BaRGS_00011302 [Batillaria attramentaria]|uniref:Uncharacterized protein n=1 Tax=Batillaria attramentaria TaxID=370345 RepID=A0ABD0J660_9CAEN
MADAKPRRGSESEHESDAGTSGDTDRISSLEKKFEAFQASVQQLLSSVVDQVAPAKGKKPKRKLEALSGLSDSDSESDKRGVETPPPKKLKKDEKAVAEKDVECIEIHNDVDLDVEDFIEHEENDILDEVEQQLSDKERTGPKVKDKLAGLVNGMFVNKLPHSVQKEKFEAMKRPENCEKMIVPTVNKEIWKKLNFNSRKVLSRDKKVSHIQRAIVKAAGSITLLADVITSADQKRKCTDALILMGHACRELSVLRRSLMCPPMTTSLLSDALPITDKLFGADDEISRIMRNERSISASLSSKNDDYRYGKGSYVGSISNKHFPMKKGDFQNRPVRQYRQEKRFYKNKNQQKY